jgi:hypothetical protein
MAIARPKIDDEFEMVKESVKTDGRGRISLGENYKDGSFQVLANQHGEILLRRMISVPAREAWLYENPKALNSVRKGIEQARQGKLVKGPDLNDASAFATKIPDDE